jgi:predicted RNA-binding Zn-ribbon protein involved in translation (DUF1610 family)
MRAIVWAIAALVGLIGALLMGINVDAGYGRVTAISGIPIRGDLTTLAVIFLAVAAILFAIGAVVGSTGSSAQPLAKVERTTKKCPACAEEILVEAAKCRYCGEQQSAPAAT